MASIHRYEASRGRNQRERTRYAVKYKQPNGKWTFKRGFKTKTEAEQFKNSVETAISRNEYVAPSGSKTTIAELAPGWLHRKEVALKASSYRSLETAWRIHVAPVWGQRTVKSITPTEVEEWVADLQAGTTATGRKAVGATVTIRAHEVLAGLLDDSVKNRQLLANPARGIKLPRKGHKSNVYLTHEQVRALAAAAGENESLVYVLAYTGIRWGEAAGLQVKHIDFEKRRLNIIRNAVEVQASNYDVTTPKSGKGRLVPFPAFIVPHLRQACKDKIGEASVFTHPSGGFIKHPHSHNGWFVRALAAAGIEKKITPHDLRHSAASFAVASGASVKLVQRMLGHKDAAMTLNIYADLFEDEIDTVSEAMGRAYVAAL